MSDPRPGRLRLLWSFTAPHRRTLALGGVLGLIGSAAGLATPMITKAVLDSLGTPASIAIPVAVLLTLLVLSVCVRALQSIVLGVVGERIVLEARESMVRRLIHGTVQSVTSRPAGELVTRVTSDSVLLQEATSTSVVGLINGSVMLAGTLVLMGVLDRPLLATTVACIVVVSIVFLLLMPGVADHRQAAQQQLGRVGGLLEATLRAIRTVKASRAEQVQSAVIVDAAEAANRHAVQAVRRESVAEAIAWAGVDLAIIVILTVGAWRVGHSAMELSTLVAFLLYAFGLIDPVTELSSNVATVQNGIAAAGRIREVQDMEVETSLAPANPPAVSPHSGTTPVLELRNVTAGYGRGTAAVANVDIAIPRYGHTAIVGPSGSGKTTLLSLILRFLEPSDGELFLNGRSYRELTHAQIREQLAYVEQDTPTLPGSIRDNLVYPGRTVTDEKIRSVLAEVGLLDDIAELERGVDTDLTATVLSTGQRQRIALARAMIQLSPVLILDEATAHADGLSEAAIQSCIRLRAEVQSVVTVAHRLSTVVDADTIVVMQGGRVRAQGTHTELLTTDELYRDLVDAMRIPGSWAPGPPTSSQSAAGSGQVGDDAAREHRSG
ncbi:ABC transporter ATP-binding protein [Mycobacterium sp. shizuoka-1]|uniref:ABC transporter ATP-binding protein n=1 Tax=Mycobacterium sp. shizuoka-1 TaxID=2039281 RepID=UPI001E5BE1A2|nr:ABC transporter ATP-binding protein [Mycobacterium sp. shizuoka-1]